VISAIPCATRLFFFCVAWLFAFLHMACTENPFMQTEPTGRKSPSLIWYE
jgi:hypothetical protein